jgi:hypothetical protein
MALATPSLIEIAAAAIADSVRSGSNFQSHHREAVPSQLEVGKKGVETHEATPKLHRPIPTTSSILCIELLAISRQQGSGQSRARSRKNDLLLAMTMVRKVDSRGRSASKSASLHSRLVLLSCTFSRQAMDRAMRNFCVRTS